MLQSALRQIPNNLYTDHIVWKLKRNTFISNSWIKEVKMEIRSTY